MKYLNITPTIKVSELFYNPAVVSIPTVHNGFKYSNNTSIDIDVISQDGVIQTIKAAVKNATINNPSAYGNFIIEKSYCIIGVSDVRDFINKNSNPTQEDQVRLVNEVINLYNHRPDLYGLLAVMSYEITPVSIIENVSSYINRTGLVLTAGDVQIQHPMVDVENVVLSKDIAVKQNICGLHFEIIDNDKQVHTKFIYSAKEVVRIPTNKDASKASGVYYSKIIPEEGKLREEVVYTTFEDAETILGIYDTWEECNNNCNPEKLAEKLIKDAKYIVNTTAIKKAEAQLEEVRQKIEDQERLRKQNEEIQKAADERRRIDDDRIRKLNEEAEAKRQREEERLSKQREEQDQRERDRQKREDEFYERSYKRKEKGDILKFLPSFILGLLTLGTLVFRTATGV